MLKRNSTELEWNDAVSNPKVSKEHVDQLLSKTISEINTFIGNKKVAVAYSGGKDATVLLEVMKRSNVPFSVFNVLTEVEYPQFRKWLDDQDIPNYQEVIVPIDWQWVNKNEHMLFPRDSKLAGRWYQIVQHKGQKHYATNNDIDVLILGRRKADGNYVGPKGKNYYKKKTESFYRFSPISDWTHEEAMAFINYYNLDLAPIYKYPNGFRNGTHPIPARVNTTSDKEALDELMQIDKKIVEDMAKNNVKIAVEYLEGGM